MIASHYAAPVERSVVAATELRCAPEHSSTAIREVKPGERFDLLDDSLGWAWGYAGNDRRVGYVRSEALGPA